jgi:hypothetical protein
MFQASQIEMVKVVYHHDHLKEIVLGGGFLKPWDNLNVFTNSPFSQSQFEKVRHDFVCVLICVFV